MDIVGKHMTSLGFKKVSISNSYKSLSCDLYLRSPIQVLRAQIQKASSLTTVFNPLGREIETTFSHPLHTDLGNKAYKAVQDFIVGSHEKDVLWHSKDVSYESSFVAILQLYFDKSRTSLKESSFEFYSIHLTMINFSEEHRRNCITNGDKFLAFLLVAFFTDNNNGRIYRNVDRETKMQMLHQTINVVMEEIRTTATQDFPCTDSQGNRRKCHPCLSSYCCDLPEGKDITSVKRGNQSHRNCHRCMAGTVDFNKYSNSAPRTVKDTIDVIRNAQLVRNTRDVAQSEKVLSTLSLSSQLPSLCNFPFMSVHPLLDLHMLFAFEPLHTFHLRISKDLKKFLSERFKISSCHTTAVPTNTGKRRNVSFQLVRLTILRGINRLLAQIQLRNPPPGLRVYVGSSGSTEVGDGLYNDEGNVIGMLEAKDYKSIDTVFPFIGLFVDRCCAEAHIGATTKVFTRYVDTMLVAMSYIGSPEWTESRIRKLEENIRIFKSECRELFGEYQASHFRTEKFHLLDHIGFDLRHNGGLRYGDAGLYDYAHTKFKSSYQAGSKRRNSAMKESINNFTKDICMSVIDLPEPGSRRTKRAHSVKKNSAHLEALGKDCAAFTRTESLFLISEVERGKLIFGGCEKQS